jgi:hypothetical protein
MIGTGVATLPTWKSLTSSDASVSITQTGSAVDIKAVNQLVNGGAISSVLGSTYVQNADHATLADNATKLTGGTAGAVVYQSAQGTTGYVTGAAGQVLRSNGAAAPSWVDQSTLVAGSANSIAWSNVSGKPTTATQLGITMSADTLIGRADTSGIAGEITIGAGLSLNSNTISISGGSRVRQYVIATTGDWNKPIGCTAVEFVIIGATGGGGASIYNWNTYNDFGHMAPNGALAYTKITNPNNKYSFIIGAGGAGGIGAITSAHKNTAADYTTTKGGDSGNTTMIGYNLLNQSITLVTVNGGAGGIPGGAQVWAGDGIHPNNLTSSNVTVLKDYVQDLNPNGYYYYRYQQGPSATITWNAAYGSTLAKSSIQSGTAVDTFTQRTSGSAMVDQRMTPSIITDSGIFYANSGGAGGFHTLFGVVDVSLNRTRTDGRSGQQGFVIVTEYY